MSLQKTVFVVQSALIDFPLDFWQKTPALLVGLCVLLGTASSLAWHPLYLLFLICILCPFIAKRTFPFPFFCAAILCLFAGASTHMRISRVKLPEDKVQGTGQFHIDNLSILSSPFNRSYYYKGMLKSFSTEDGKTYSNLPCGIFLPLKKKTPSADSDYIIEGTLLQKKEHQFCLKPKKGKAWTSVKNSFSLAQWRYELKRKISTHIKNCISDAKSASFLSALITGDVDERSIRLDLNRLGLQHLLAISGFHFSFFSLLLSVLLRPFFSFSMRNGALIAVLALYFLFLGPAPSILRAFTTIVLFLSAQSLKRKNSALNALGAALVLELFLDPLVLTQLSFQLSFLCTLSLLLFYPLAHHCLCFLLPERTMMELDKMPFFDQHGYVLSALIRKSLSVNAAVCLFSLPVLLHLFHRFPLLSLVYNLFVPLCVSLSLLLLCLALLSSFLPPLSSFLHALNNSWTSSLLQLTSHPPAYFDVVLRTKAVSFPVVLCTLLVLFYVGIYFSCWKQRLISKT